MRRLLIVDDEAIITDGLAEILGGLGIPGLEICTAYSGVEALEWLRSTRIDLVLSDIWMPELDGLELLEIIRREWPRCRVIFLTGHNDFEPVYKAIQTWGVRYLLKSEGYAKVIAEVHDALRELDESLHADSLLRQAREQRNTLETLAQGDYFRHLLLGTANVPMEDREEDLRKLNVPLDPAMPVMLVLGSLMHAESRSSYAARQEAALAAKLLGDACFHDKARCVGIVDRYGDLLWMVQPASGTEAAAASYESVTRFLEGTLEFIQGACMESLGMESAFTICSTPVPWEALPGAYDRLRQLQHQRAGDGTSMVLTVPLNLAQPAREGLRSEKLEPLAGLLEAGRRDEYLALLRDLSDAVLGEPPAESAQVLELYYSIALLLLAYINRRQFGDRLSVNELMRFEGHASRQDAFAYLNRVADQLFALRRTGENSRAEGVIEGICAYIEEHIADDLSIVRIAGRFHFNAAYLSRLFKQVRGHNLSDYIEEARIRRAKSLLAVQDLRIHEVGAQVGYESPHSFTRFFKKSTGMTPQEYREYARAEAR